MTSTHEVEYLPCTESSEPPSTYARLGCFVRITNGAPRTYNVFRNLEKKLWEELLIHHIHNCTSLFIVLFRYYIGFKDTDLNSKFGMQYKDVGSSNGVSNRIFPSVSIVNLLWNRQANLIHICLGLVLRDPEQSFTSTHWPHDLIHQLSGLWKLARQSKSLCLLKLMRSFLSWELLQSWLSSASAPHAALVGRIAESCFKILQAKISRRRMCG